MGEFRFPRRGHACRPQALQMKYPDPKQHFDPIHIVRPTTVCKSKVRRAASRVGITTRCRSSVRLDLQTEVDFSPVRETPIFAMKAYMALFGAALCLLAGVSAQTTGSTTYNLTLTGALTHSHLQHPTQPLLHSIGAVHLFETCTYRLCILACCFGCFPAHQVRGLCAVRCMLDRFCDQPLTCTCMMCRRCQLPPNHRPHSRRSVPRHQLQHRQQQHHLSVCCQ